MDQTEQMRSVVAWMISGGPSDELGWHSAASRPGIVARAAAALEDRLRAVVARPARAERLTTADCVGC
jgi:hypothetical protein